MRGASLFVIESFRVAWGTLGGLPHPNPVHLLVQEKVIATGITVDCKIHHTALAWLGSARDLYTF